MLSHLHWYRILYNSKISRCLEDVCVDGDNPEHLQWIYEQALRRSQEYSIKGVTYRLTQGTFYCILPLMTRMRHISSLQTGGSTRTIDESENLFWKVWLNHYFVYTRRLCFTSLELLKLPIIPLPPQNCRVWDGSKRKSKEPTCSIMSTSSAKRADTPNGVDFKGVDEVCLKPKIRCCVIVLAIKLKW